MCAALWEPTYNLTGGSGSEPAEPEELHGVRVTRNLFSLLGTKPVLGRVFLPEEDRPGGAHVALISHGLWVRRFGADPGLVGRDIL